MVRNYVKKKPSYDQENMRQAVALVEAGTAGYKKAAKMFDVKWQTVRDHVKKRYHKMGE